jgi:hypothetical protein
MLTLYIYKGVKLQKDHANVILFNDAQDVLNYLSTSLVGTISNINKFYSNETFIDVNLYYENCNYMCIYDDRSDKPYKFFFIDNFEFINGSTIRYYITLDFWTSYSYDIVFKPSRMIQGHTDALDVTDCKRGLINTPFGANNLAIEKYLIDKWDDTKNATIFVTCNMTTTDSSFLTFNFINAKSDNELFDALRRLRSSKFHYKSTPTSKGTFEILQAYIVNNVDFKAILDEKQTEEGLSLTYLESYELENGVYTPSTNPFYTFTGFGVKTGVIPIETHALPLLKLKLREITLFNNNEDLNTRVQRLLKLYRVGSLTTNQEIKIDTEFNNTITLNMYIFNEMQLAFMLECNGMTINLSNDFMIPFINDSYTLYMSRNQATIDANNKSVAVGTATSLAMSALSLLLAPMTAGASVMVGAGAIASSINSGMQAYKMRAQLEDAKKQPDRLDGIFTSGMITLSNGVGLWAYTFANTNEMQTDYNNFGTMQSVFVDKFVTEHANDYNFYFIQFDDINLYGEFNYDIKTEFERLFTKGFRIWTSKDLYLNDVKYKK